MIVKTLGILSIILALLAIMPTLVSGVGLVLALGILIFSGITALFGNIKYAIIVLLITTLNIAILSSSILGWSPFYDKDEPLPEGIPAIKDLPSINFPGTQELAEKISKASGIAIEDLKNIKVTEAITTDKKSEVFNLLSFVSIPYLIAIFLILAGYFSHRKSPTKAQK